MSDRQRRVKVYLLRDEQWVDRGTGHVSVQLLNGELHLEVRSEDDGTRGFQYMICMLLLLIVVMVVVVVGVGVEGWCARHS